METGFPAASQPRPAAVRSRARFRWIAPGAGAISCLIGAAWLVLWLLGVPPRWSAAGMVTMKTNMALAQLLAGAALLLLQGGGATPRRRRVGTALAALVTVIGGLTLVEHVFRVDLGIDQLIAGEPPGQPGVVRPNRMGPPGALALTLIGTGLLFLARGRRTAVLLGAITCAVVSIPAIGILYGASALHSSTVTAIAWPTVVALLALGLGLAAAETGDGGVPLFWRDDAGGALMRRALGPAVLLPIAIGYVRLVGERQELYERLVGTSLFAVTLAILFALLLWRSATRLSAVAAEERRGSERLRASEARFRSVFEQAAIGMGRVGFADARWIDVNDTLCRMVGYSREELLRTPWPEITHPDDVDLDLVPFRRMAAGELESYSVEKRFLHARGHEVWARLTLSLVRDAAGRPDYEIAIIEDVGDRKRAEEGLRLAHARLEEVDRRKDEFLGVLSHELRNPLTPIRTGVFLLRRTTGLDPRGRRSLEVIDRQVSLLSRLIDDLLDVTRIARGKVRLQRSRFDLAQVVRQIVEDHREAMAAARLEIRVDVPPAPIPVEADSARIAQAVGNLLQNAVKFTPAGGAVEIAAARERDRARVEVRDTGVGIEAEMLGRLFEPFTQADRSLERSRGGLGLGLALTKGLVELHGGRIRVDSDGPGRGTRFTIELPTAAEEEPPGAAAGEPAGAGSPAPLRILVIEDNRDAADSLREVLEFGGHQVEVAYDGHEGVAKARASVPDVVFSDIGLPGLDGYQVARTLRADAGPPTCLVALSGYAQAEDVQRAREAGFDRHLPKPPDLEAIDRILLECREARTAGGGASPA